MPDYFQQTKQLIAVIGQVADDAGGIAMDPEADVHAALKTVAMLARDSMDRVGDIMVPQRLAITCRADLGRVASIRDKAPWLVIAGIDASETLWTAGEGAERLLAYLLGAFSLPLDRQRLRAVVVAAGDTANQLRDRLEVESAKAADAPGKGAGDIPLNDRQQLVLQVLFRQEAFDSDHRMTTEDIVSGIAKNADSVQYKPVVASLVRLGYIQTKRGGGGGCWLTPEGQSRAKAIVA